MAAQGSFRSALLTEGRAVLPTWGFYHHWTKDRGYITALTGTTFPPGAHPAAKHHHMRQSGSGSLGVYWLQFLGARYNAKKQTEKQLE